jgi:hypothetical protein
LSSPVKEVVDAVYDRCSEMDLMEIMSFRCDWNEEVVAQFYATLFVEQDEELSIGQSEESDSDITWLSYVLCPRPDDPVCLAVPLCPGSDDPALGRMI